MWLQFIGWVPRVQMEFHHIYYLFFGKLKNIANTSTQDWCHILTLPCFIRGSKQESGWKVLIFPFIDFLSTSVHFLRKFLLPALFCRYLIIHICSLVCKPIENRCHMSSTAISHTQCLSSCHVLAGT